MKKAIHLYWQETCQAAVGGLVEALTAVFPVSIDLAGVLEPMRQAFDTARGCYDAAWLLREIPETNAIWLIDEDISYAGYDFLYGAARLCFAVVSAARLGFLENLYKEACHELGHLLSLDHCLNACLMNTASNWRHIAAKPLALCAECSALLAEINPPLVVPANKGVSFLDI